MGRAGQRRITTTLFFLLFVFAPILDLFRFDLYLNQFILLGQPLGLGVHEASSAAERSLNVLLRFVVPLVGTILVGVWVAWRWGRFYCGWACPHFVVVDLLNRWMRRASGKSTLWQRQQLPLAQQDGSSYRINRWWWLAVVVGTLFFALLWSVVLLTYLLPPVEVYGNLFSASLSRNQLLFIGVGTLLWALEFMLARHLFCKFGCAVGISQSVVWMGNRNGVVLSFDQSRAALCGACDASCELVCPMQLNPRGLKRHKISCTQCMKCIDACEQVQRSKGELPLLKMLRGECAQPVAGRGLGQKLDAPMARYSLCYSEQNRGKMSCRCDQSAG